MSASLEELARRSLDWASAAAGPGCEVELFLAREEERALTLRDGALDGRERAAVEGAGLRLLSEGRLAFAAGSGLGREAIEGLAREALAQLAHLGRDEAKTLPEVVDTAPEKETEFARSLWDDSSFTEPLEAIENSLRDVESSARSADRRVRRVVGSEYSESRLETVVASSRGVLASGRSTAASLSLEALAEDDGETQVGSSFQSSRRRSGLDWRETGRQAGARAAAMLGARKAKGGRRDLVFDPWVSVEFLELIAELLCADQVQQGKSLLAGRLGRRIASPEVTIIDDPLLPGGAASSLHDDEGLPSVRKALIEGGTLREYFHDATTAARDGRRSNASAGRASYRSLPSPGSTNFYLAPGALSREELLARTKSGILVHQAMGLHMVDTVSGEFSVGVSGLEIEDGRVKGPVRGAMVSGNLLDLLARVDAVAGDLTFHGSHGAPTFRVGSLDVA